MRMEDIAGKAGVSQAKARAVHRNLLPQRILAEP